MDTGFILLNNVNIILTIRKFVVTAVSPVPNSPDIGFTVICMSEFIADTSAHGSKVIQVHFKVVINEHGIDITIFLWESKGVNVNGCIIVPLCDCANC